MFGGRDTNSRSTRYGSPKPIAKGVNNNRKIVWKRMMMQASPVPAGEKSGSFPILSGMEFTMTSCLRVECEVNGTFWDKYYHNVLVHRCDS